MQYISLSAHVLLLLPSTLAFLLESVFSVAQERLPGKILGKGSEALNEADAEYGVSPFISLIRRGQQGTVTADPNAFYDGTTSTENEYLSPIYIGTPPQKFLVLLSTALSDFWVYSSETPTNEGRNNHTYYDMTKSSTSKKLYGYTFNLTAENFALGEIYTDVVQFDGIESSTQAIEVPKVVSLSFSNDAKFSGYLGLGHDGGISISPLPQKSYFANSISWLASILFTPSNIRKTFFTNIAPSLASPLFTASINHLNPGSYDFGFIDPRKHISPIVYVPALPPPRGHGFWIADAKSFYIGDSKTMMTFTPGTNQAVIDTGSTFLMLQQKYCDAYYAQAPNLINDPDYGEIYPCQAMLPDLTLVLEGYKARISGALLRGSVANETMCYPAIIPIAVVPGNVQAVFGRPFLKTTFTLFEYPPGGLPILGFASKPISSSYKNTSMP